MNGPRIFLTGCTGFVGRHVAQRLASGGCELVLGTRNSAGARLSIAGRPGVRVVETGPLETCSDLQDVLAGIDAVIHVAGMAAARREGPDDAETQLQRANAVATVRLAEAARLAGVKRFVHLSSLAVVTGGSADSVVGDEETGFRPATPYGRSKLAAERSVQALAEAGMFVMSLRPPLIFGGDAGGKWRALQRLAATGLPLPFADVRNQRSLLGVDTLAGVLAGLALRPRDAALSGAYCIAEREPLGLREIVSELRAGMGRQTRLFGLPAGVMLGMARMLGQAGSAEGLFGNLVVDSTRFWQSFDMQGSSDIRADVRASGRDFVAARSR